jgi:hypothetical protein
MRNRGKSITTATVGIPSGAMVRSVLGLWVVLNWLGACFACAKPAQSQTTVGLSRAINAGMDGAPLCGATPLHPNDSRPTCCSVSSSLSVRLWDFPTWLIWIRGIGYMMAAYSGIPSWATCLNCSDWMRPVGPLSLATSVVTHWVPLPEAPKEQHILWQSPKTNPLQS